jgi:hypothetical protein
MWRPKLPMLEKPCVSCPFSKGNDVEFAAVVQRLDPTLKGIALAAATMAARNNIETESLTRGDFSCHHTAYDKDMNVKPIREHRQCPGAAKSYVDAGEEMMKRYQNKKG